MTRLVVCLVGVALFALACVMLAPVALAVMAPLWCFDLGAWPPRAKPAVRPRPGWQWARSEN